MRHPYHMHLIQIIKKFGKENLCQVFSDWADLLQPFFERYAFGVVFERVRTQERFFVLYPLLHRRRYVERHFVHLRDATIFTKGPVAVQRARLLFLLATRRQRLLFIGGLLDTHHVLQELLLFVRVALDATIL